MANENGSGAQPRKITVGFLIAWAWTIFAGLGGFAMMVQGHVGPGFFAMLSGIVACPAFHGFAKTNLKIDLSGMARFVIALLLLFIAGVLLPKAREGETVADQPSGSAARESAAAQSARAPSTLLDIQGDGTKTTEKFTTSGDDWDMSWSYNCSGFGGRGNFIVEVASGDGGFSSNQSVNQLGASGSDVEHYHSGGTFYLKVSSECSWSIKVVG